jgi:hypothetical protein
MLRLNIKHLKIGQYAQRMGALKQVDLIRNLEPEFFKDEDKTFVDTTISYSDYKQKLLKIEHSETNLLEKGLQIKQLVSMMNARNVPPLQTHYKPMIHILGSAGMVDETYSLYYQATEKHFHDPTDARYILPLVMVLTRGDKKEIKENYKNYFLPWLKKMDDKKLASKLENRTVKHILELCGLILQLDHVQNDTEFSNSVRDVAKLMWPRFKINDADKHDLAFVQRLLMQMLPPNYGVAMFGGLLNSNVEQPILLSSESWQFLLKRMEPGLKNQIGNDRDDRFLEASTTVFKQYIESPQGESVKKLGIESSVMNNEIKRLNEPKKDGNQGFISNIDSDGGETPEISPYSRITEISVLNSLENSPENKYNVISRKLNDISSKQINFKPGPHNVAKFVEIFGGVDGVLDELEKSFDFRMNELTVRYISTRGPKIAMFKQVQVDYVSSVKRELEKDVTSLTNNIAQLINLIRLLKSEDLVVFIERIDEIEARLKDIIWKNKIDIEHTLKREKVTIKSNEYFEKVKTKMVKELDPSLTVWNHKMAISLANKAALGRNHLGVYGYHKIERIDGDENINKLYSEFDQAQKLLDYVEKTNRSVSPTFFGYLIQQSNLKWQSDLQARLAESENLSWRSVLSDEKYLKLCVKNIKNGLKLSVAGFRKDDEKLFDNKRLPLAHGRCKLILKCLKFSLWSKSSIELSNDFWVKFVTTVKDLENYSGNLNKDEYKEFLRNQDIILRKIVDFSKKIPTKKSTKSN